MNQRIPNYRFAVWLSDPNCAAAEIARHLGYGAVVLDIEHGAFGLADLERFTPFLKALGLDVLAKVLAPERAPIQQALDFGADAVVLPHIKSAAHAREVTAFAKFPPAGDRSLAGGRTIGYSPYTDEWLAAEDARIRCYPMIEHAGALAEVGAILDLPTVDGVFVGPGDLSVRRDRGAYSRDAGDFADQRTIANAARSAGKHWVMPAWNEDEKKFALEHGAHQLALTMQHDALRVGLSAAFHEASALAEEVSS
ncbi:HpcH/HpaI aldolase/citrate lyase family protein [Saccharopolyspora sp. ASAGF58]|uniref:HpcH/HpaI aldolase family protein n=1 Tax=Saccharopolyspora sp. ASAGF58 TaxID=2719023 RepID=UPI00143FC630|nr:aldolase/citrate lyase family protein [Saccharopolyspora sp. ASAGF58]QIZ37378.1 4-hydroxy-2-oxovalerate aldolase [Saccharopolyspora sp. ASAGF58]